MFLIGTANRSEFTSDYSVQLAIVICSYAPMEKHVSPHASYPCDWALYSGGSP